MARAFPGHDTVEQVALLEVAVDLCETAYAACTLGQSKDKDDRSRNRGRSRGRHKAVAKRKSDAPTVAPAVVAQVADASASAYLTVGVTLSKAYQLALSSADDRLAAPGDDPRDGVVATRTSMALLRALRLYEFVGNELQAAAALFQLASYHSANALNPAVSDRPEHVRYVASVADDYYKRAAVVFATAPAPAQRVVASLAHRQRAELFVALSQREVHWPSAAGGGLRAQQQRLLQAAHAVACCASVVRSCDGAQADVASAAAAELDAVLDAARHTLMQLKRALTSHRPSIASKGLSAVKVAYAAVLGASASPGVLSAALDKAAASLPTSL